MKALIFFTLLLFSNFASAHPLDMGYLEIDYNSTRGKLRLDFDYNPAALKTELSLERLFAFKNCRWGKLSKLNITLDKSRLSGTADCNLKHDALTLKMHTFTPFVESYQVVGRISIDNNESTFLINQKTADQTFILEQQKSFFNFVMMGIEHIGVTTEQWHNKIPDGIDHILFVVALVLLGGGLKNTIKVVSGFTLGHCLSLILATFNVVSISPSIIEPAIALSIVYVAAEAVILKKSTHRWIVSGFFGMIHGFGFATALQGLHLTTSKMIAALVGFNLGVEAGQVVIILITAPIIMLLSYRPPLHKFATKYASLCIMTLASFWFIQRTLL